ncbi:hypothetical protein N0V88_008114 [Collariella sp. IMI 366227]|nr:hypothetical protein N0V88_008114 [Collariella sp. IMI 366227]
MRKLASNIVVAVLHSADDDDTRFQLQVLEMFVIPLSHQFGDGENTIDKKDPADMAVPEDIIEIEKMA